MLLWLAPQRKMKNQSVVMMKQKTETNITHPRGFSGSTRVDATSIHTKPPNTCRVTPVKEGDRDVVFVRECTVL